MHGMNKFNLYRYRERKCLSGADISDRKEGLGTLVWENGCSQRPSFNHLEKKEGRKPMLFSIFITSPDLTNLKWVRTEKKGAFYPPGLRNLVKVNNRHSSSKLHKQLQSQALCTQFRSCL